MQAITITLNGIEVSGHAGMTILDLARESGVDIPTLCHDPHLVPYGACRICLVEDERNGALLASCVAPIAPGMIIRTHSEKVLESRRTIVKLILASHPDSCMVCDKGNRCALRQIASDLGIGLVDYQRIPHSAIIQELNPFIERDLSKCILCAKCIRADHELVVKGAIDYMNRGFTSIPATLGNVPLEKSDCTFCGTCVALCPTGALSERIKPYHGTTTKVVSTVCSFCGCGCNINLEVSSNRVIRAMPSDGDSPNGATLCARGAYGFDFIHSPERLIEPLINEGGEFHPISWDEALRVAAERLGEIKSNCGPDSIGILGSSKCTNEDNYVLQKFARDVLGTANIDHGGRFYNTGGNMILGECLGFPASTNPTKDIEQSGVIVLIGTDTESSAPLVSYAIKRAVKRGGAKLVLIDSQQNGLAPFAHLHLRPTPGTETSLLNGIMWAIINEGTWDQDFVAQRAENFEPLVLSLQDFMPDSVRESTSIPPQNVHQAALLLSGANGLSIIYGSEIVQSSTGTQAVTALVNLAILTGNLGQERGGIFALQKENNGQGASDMGCLPDFLPGYRPVDGSPGLTALQMVEQAKDGKIKGMYIMGENITSSYPNRQYAKDALATVDFLVVQDLFLTETARLAHLVLPAASFAEKDGSFTNFERRVQRVRKAIDAPGESLPDWQIIVRLANRMGHPMKYASSEEIMDEIQRTVPLYQGISHAVLNSKQGYWPKSDADHQGTARLYEGGFIQGYGRFSPPTRLRSQREIQEESQLAEQLPMRTVYQFGSGVRSSKSERLSAMLAMKTGNPAPDVIGAGA